MLVKIGVFNADFECDALIDDSFGNWDKVMVEKSEL